MNSFSAIILAGGPGTRLKPVLPDIPKILAPVHGRPFLQLLLERIRPAGPTEFILCLSRLTEQVRSLVGDEFQGVPVRYSVESTPMGTGGAIRLGLEKSRNTWSLICNGDSFCHMTWPDLISWYGQSVQPGGALVVTRVPDTSRFGLVSLNAQNRVTAFHEKNSLREPGLINAGIYLLPRNLAARIPGDRPVSWEHECLPQILSENLRAFVAQGPFIDIGTPESYASATDFFADLKLDLDPGGPVQDDALLGKSGGRIS